MNRYVTRRLYGLRNVEGPETSKKGRGPVLEVGL